jgi:hypothetical protein
MSKESIIRGTKSQIKRSSKKANFIESELKKLGAKRLEDLEYKTLLKLNSSLQYIEPKKRRFNKELDDNAKREFLLNT